MTFNIDVKVDLEKLKFEITARTPENDRDENFKREFFRTSVDVSKFYAGIGGSSFIMRPIMEAYIKAIDFEPKFPMKKVFVKNEILTL